MKQRKINILLSLLVMVMISVLSANAAFAGSTHVVIDKGTITKTAIPSDFPVMMNTANPAADQENFDKAVSEWKGQHPEFSNLDMTPSHVSGRFIQISQEDLNGFSPEKRQAILENSSFYQIIQ